MAGRRVYISFAAEDAAQCNLLTAALDAWEVTYTTARPALPQGDQLPDIEKVAIRDCEVFLRLCTATTKRSESMHQDLRYFDTLQAEDRSKHQREQRALVNLILDANYQREPFDNVTLFIDTANKSRAFWLDELAHPLGVATPARRLSRRSASLALLPSRRGARLRRSLPATKRRQMRQQGSHRLVLVISWAVRPRGRWLSATSPMIPMIQAIIA